MSVNPGSLLADPVKSASDPDRQMRGIATLRTETFAARAPGTHTVLGELLTFTRQEEP